MQIIDDGIQVRNRNFVQSTELVRWVIHSGEFSVVTLLHLLLMGSFAGRSCRSKHGVTNFQAGLAEREMQSASLKQAKLACRHLELEAKESAERASRAEAERDAACHEVAMAKLTAEGALSTRAQIESELARVQRALGLAEEACRKAEFDRRTAQEVLAATRGDLQEG